MSHKILLFGLVTFLLACQVPKAQAPEFTQEQLIDDLKSLVETLKSYHAGLYWYQNEEDFNSEVSKVEKAIANGGNFLEYYASINRLTASIGCGHTRSRMPQERANSLLDTTRVLPLNVFINDEKIYTTTSAQGVVKGSEILSINKLKSKEIIEKLRAFIPSDGYNTTGKDHSIGPRFGLLLAIYLGVDGPTSDVEFIPPNSSKSENIVLEHEKIIDNTPNKDVTLMALTDAPFDKTKILSIKTFGEGALERAGFNYYEFLEASFIQLKKEATKHLIIDVRGNGGGNDDYGATLVSYITSQSFGYFDRIEVTESYKGSARIERAEDGKRLMISHQDLAVQGPAANRFTGEVYILADGGSFSTTADFVSISKNISAATIVGIETGGGACGNTSGHSTRITLENTGISVGIPMWHYYSATESSLPCGHGIYPDHKVVDLPYTDQDEVINLVGSLIKN